MNYSSPSAPTVYRYRAAQNYWKLISNSIWLGHTIIPFRPLVHQIKEQTAKRFTGACKLSCASGTKRKFKLFINNVCKVLPTCGHRTHAPRSESNWLPVGDRPTRRFNRAIQTNPPVRCVHFLWLLSDQIFEYLHHRNQTETVNGQTRIIGRMRPNEISSSFEQRA